ncbi:replicative DNA helicase [Lactococcus lactis subsp. lactis IO-1]|nr:replicative DNA helicase [Lactococcus lactis subsp. lactis IO-1]
MLVQLKKIYKKLRKNKRKLNPINRLLQHKQNKRLILKYLIEE